MVNWSFYQYVVSFWSQVTVFSLKPILSHVIIAAPTVFGYFLHEIFFPAFQLETDWYQLETMVSLA